MTWNPLALADIFETRKPESPEDLPGDWAILAIGPNEEDIFLWMTEDEDDENDEREIDGQSLLAAAISLRIQEDEEFVNEMMQWMETRMTDETDA